MKKWFGILGGLVVVLGLGGLAWAGDYHSGANLVCADCHTMHSSQAHDYSSTGGAATFTPSSFLLKNGDAVCLVCHDGSTTAGPDVLGANSGTNVRQAGALNKLGGAGAGYEEYKGHTLGSTAVAPGGTWADGTTGLECVHCHHQHGSAGTGSTDLAGNAVTSAWRNLRAGAGSNTWPTKNVSYAVGTNVTTKDIFERDATLGQFGTHYAYTNVDFNNPVAADSAMSKWCGNCHGNFHGAVGGTEVGGSAAGGFIRHPAGGVAIGVIGGGHSSKNTFATGLRTGGTPGVEKTNYVKVMSATGKWDAASGITGANVDGQPTCLTCHKAHGNKNPFGLIFMENTGTITEEGTATGVVKSLCKQCHIQG